MTIEGIIFDNDGTLVDSETLSAQVIVDILGEFGVAARQDLVFERLQGAQFSLVAESLMADFPVMDVDHFTKTFRARTAQVFAQRLKPMDGAVELVSGLTLEKSVASNGPRAKMELCLGATGLLPYFEGRLASAYEIGSWKPDPALILHAAAMMNVPARRCLLVDDSLAGVEAGLAAGVSVVGYRLSAKTQRSLSRPVPVIQELGQVRELAGLGPAKEA